MNTETTTATVYYDTDTDPRNPGYVIATSDGQTYQGPGDPDATEEELRREALRYADEVAEIRDATPRDRERHAAELARQNAPAALLSYLADADIDMPASALAEAETVWTAASDDGYIQAADMVALASDPRHHTTMRLEQAMRLVAASRL